MRYLRPIVMAMMVLGAMLLAQPTGNAEPDEPVLDGPDFELVPPEAPGEPGEGEAPSATQTSEFLAGRSCTAWSLWSPAVERATARRRTRRRRTGARRAGTRCSQQ